MAKRSKLFEKLRRNPKGAKFADVKRLLLAEGFVLERVSGSHHVFARGTVTFVIPLHGKEVKSVYVRRVIEILESTEDETG